MAFVKPSRKKKDDTEEALALRDSPDEMLPEEDYREDKLGENPVVPPERALPKPKGIALSFDGLMEYLASFTSEHWTHAIVYVFRIFPKIDRKRVADNSNNIDKISQPITKQEFVRKHGGGKYKIFVNDLDKKYGSTVVKCVFDIDWTVYEPILDLDELVMEDDKNKAYITKLINQGKLHRQGGSLVPMNPNLNNSETMAQLMRDMMGMFKSMSKEQVDNLKASAGNSDSSRMIELLLKERDSKTEFLEEQLKQASPANSMNMVKDVITMIGAATKKDESTGVTGLFQQLMGFIVESNKQNMEMMKQVVESIKPKESNGENGGIGSKVEDLKSLLELSNMLGGGGAVKRSTAEVVVDGIQNVLEKVANPIAMVLAAKFGGGIPPGMTMNPQPQQLNPGEIHPNNVTEIPIDPNAKTTKDQLKELLGTYGNFLIKYIEQGKTGGELADMLVSTTDFFTYKQIVNFGEDTFISALKELPSLWNKISVIGEPEIRTFFKDFVAYGEEETEGPKVVQ